MITFEIHCDELQAKIRLVLEILVDYERPFDEERSQSCPRTRQAVRPGLTTAYALTRGSDSSGTGASPFSVAGLFLRKDRERGH
jgi:hypothetical protein